MKSSADDRAAADLWQRTLRQLPSTYGRMVYLASLRNANSDQYEHHGLAARFSAAQADADSIIAHKEADLTRYKVGEDTLRLQRSLRQLQAARDVAKLEWQVSVGDLAGVQARMQTGNANLRDAQLAQLDVNDKFAAYLDAEFELTRSELQLLRLTGELENWAIPTP